MTALIVIGCILLALVLIGQLRIGAALSWSEDGLSLRLKLGPLWLKLLPVQEGKKPKKERKPKKEKKKKVSQKQPSDQEEPPKRSVRDTISVAAQFLPLLAEAAGRLKRKIRVDQLRLHVIWGASNPVSAAVGYGAGNAVVSMIWPLIDYNFRVKEHDIRIDVDFERKTPALTVDAQATMTLGQSLSLALRLGVKAIKIFLGNRRKKTKQKAVQA